MSTLMKSVSGIRGIVGDSMTPDLIVKVCAAFAKYVNKGKVVVGRDSRVTGDAISKGVESMLALSGCDVVNLGIVPTPTVQIMVEELKAAGGIVISASHNPIQWNAFKLINKSGTFLNEKDIATFFSYLEHDYTYVPWNKTGEISCNNQADEIHIKHILKIVNKNRIKDKKYRVVLDSVNGAGSIITPKLLKEFNCDIIPLYCTITGDFPRGAEPLSENLKDLSKRVLKEKADIGFAQDPDADRLAIVDNKGKPIGEENTLSLVTEHLLSKKKGRVVINLSTTKTIDDIAEKYGVIVKRTKVGEINVVEEMKKKGTRIGGEGNGGVISPEVHLGRDSLVGIAYILDMMAERGKTISELVEELPSYVMKKGKIELGKGADNNNLLQKIKNDFSREKITDIDGLRIDFIKHHDFKGGWVHLRPSNTEPIFRIIAEGKNSKQADDIFNYFISIFSKK